MTVHGQKAAFLAGEADRWYERNAAAIGARRTDVVASAIESLALQPKAILEIGAANGYRLAWLAERYGARACGLEPSAKAVADGRAQFPHIELVEGSADVLPYEADSFDMVIFGFCFYLVDPTLHFRAVAEADRVLKDGGAIVIFDFLAAQPYFNDYAHLPGLRAHKSEFSRLFTAHPAYTLVHRQLDRKSENFLEPDWREGVDVLIKDMSRAFPPNPSKR